MRVMVNDKIVFLLPGMKVRHALLQLGFFEGLGDGSTLEVLDQWGNLLGLDGEVQEGQIIYVRRKENRLKDGPENANAEV